ncbi:hypothetical protein KSP40_PGU002140 [Platanthera guangdongensis]|uniref:Uncharacterized protein n=1 Tax=Platanthera guangdongensis TaxID=2320717 RepID=A0ABR2N3F3_9ASPA
MRRPIWLSEVVRSPKTSGNDDGSTRSTITGGSTKSSRIERLTENSPLHATSDRQYSYDWKTDSSTLHPRYTAARARSFVRSLTQQDCEASNKDQTKESETTILLHLDRRLKNKNPHKHGESVVEHVSVQDGADLVPSNPTNPEEDIDICITIVAIADIELGTHTIRSHGRAVAKIQMHDWIILILLIILIIILNVIEPVHYFVGRDMMADLRYPLKSNTVPVWAVPPIDKTAELDSAAVTQSILEVVQDINHAAIDTENEALDVHMTDIDKNNQDNVHEDDITREEPFEAEGGQSTEQEGKEWGTGVHKHQGPPAVGNVGLIHPRDGGDIPPHGGPTGDLRSTEKTVTCGVEETAAAGTVEIAAAGNLTTS